MTVTPTPKAVALGAALRRAREDVGLSARALSLKMHLTASTVSRWESGARSPRPVDVAAVLAVLGVPEEEREELVEMARSTANRQWIAAGLPEQRRALTALLEAERDAAEIVCLSPLLIPGLMQTSAYARAIMSGGGVPQDEVETRVRVRIGRREVYARRDRPVKVLAILGEGALRRMVGGRTVLVSQLRVLIDEASLPTVDLRIIPHSAGWSPDLEGSFDLLTFPDTRDPIVHIENRRSALFFHELDDVEAYRESLDTVMSVAMSPEASIEFIADVIKDLETTP
ncbi:helix-turn-helix domain-containing protein [Actinoalloteichus hymeniacidonis]|nr:helix-turn-helix transcriptional regulator [Actinoalloteichus hymeniacidonis]MBB5906398.1 transcriptional regulator with XRE-family HTH domain [Actinoalloteichus hymeniacidonis]